MITILINDEMNVANIGHADISIYEKGKKWLQNCSRK